MAFAAVRPALAGILAELRPDAMLLSGLAGANRALRLEYVGLHLAHVPGRPDNTGAAPELQPLVPGGPAALFATAPVQAMADAIRRSGLEAVVSVHAGAYLCNAALYHALHMELGRTSPRPITFLHVPALPDMPEARPEATLPFPRLLAAYEAAISALIPAREGALP